MSERGPREPREGELVWWSGEFTDRRRENSYRSARTRAIQGVVQSWLTALGLVMVGRFLASLGPGAVAADRPPVELGYGLLCLAAAAGAGRVSLRRLPVGLLTVAGLAALPACAKGWLGPSPPSSHQALFALAAVWTACVTIWLNAPLGLVAVASLAGLLAATQATSNQALLVAAVGGYGLALGWNRAWHHQWWVSRSPSLLSGDHLIDVFVNLSPIQTCYLSPDHHFLFANRAYAEVAGCHWSDLLGHTPEVVFHPEVAAERKQLLAQAAQGRPVMFETERRPTGERSGNVYLGTYTPDLDQAGQLRGTLVTILDATELRRTQAALADAEQRANTILGALNDVVFLVDLEAVVGYVTPSCQAAFGYQPDELVGRSGWELIHPDDQAVMKAEMVKVLSAANDHVPTEFRFLHADGSWVPCEALASAHAGHDQPAGAVVSVRVVAERAAAREAQRESEARFRALFEGSGDAVLVRDGETLRCIDANPAALKLFGCSREDLLGRRPLDVSTPLQSGGRSAEQMQQDGLKTLDRTGHLSYTGRYQRPDGTCFDAEVTAFRVKAAGSSLIFSVVRDITARLEAEERLRSSEERLQLALDSVNDGLYDWNTVTGEAHFSDRYVTMLGYEPDEIERSYGAFSALLHPEDRASVEETVAGYGRGESSTYELEFRMRAKDGTWRWIRSRGRAMAYDDDGNPVRMVGTHTDVTARRQAEDALRTSEAMMRATLDNLPVEFWAADLDGLCTAQNPAAVAAFGDCRGRNLADIDTTDEVRLRLVEAFERARSGVSVETEHEMPVAGQSRHLRTYLTPIRVGDEVVGVVGVNLDLTEHKRAEEALERRILALTRPLGATADLDFADVFNVDDLQQLQDAFAAATGVGALITDPDGRPLTRPSNFCDLCESIIRATEVGRQNCAYSDAYLGRERRDGPVVRPCLSGGLLDGATSIWVGDRHVATWLIGQVLDEGADRERICGYATEIGADQSAFRAALAEVPNMPRRQFEAVAQFLYLLARQLSLLALQNTVQAREIVERRRVEAALRDSEERFRMLAENSRDVIWRMDFDGRFTYVSPSVQQLRGITPEQAQTETLADFPPSSIPLAQQAFEAAMVSIAKGEPVAPVQLEMEQWHRDGGTVWTEVHAGVMVDAEGRPAGFVGVTRDITARRAADQRLRESEATLRAILDGSSFNIAMVDLQDYAFIEVNRALLDFHDLRREDVIGRTATELGLLAPESRGARLRSGEHEMTVEVALARADGACRRGRLTNQPVVVGGRSCLVSIWQDLTEQRLAEEALRQRTEELNQFFGINLDLLCIADQNGCFRRVNPAWEATLGYPLASLEGAQFLDLVHPDDVEATLAAMRQLSENHQVLGFQNRYRCHDGSYRWIEWRSSPAGETIYAAARDVTERVEADAERELLISNLAATNAELERFTYTVSHDLKSPLITIKGFANWLMQDWAAGRTDRVERCLDRIDSAATRMQDLLDDLLELSRIGRLVNPSEAVPLAVLAAEVQELLQGPLLEAGVTLVVEPDLPVVYGDRLRLLEVVQNLVENGIKFRGRQTAPRIEIGGCAEPGNGLVRVWVRDNGSGIEPAYQERIFNLFDQLDPSASGTGIGLALARRIVDCHGGRIWAESEGLGQGACFCFTLPAPPES